MTYPSLERVLSEKLVAGSTGRLIAGIHVGRNGRRWWAHEPQTGAYADNGETLDAALAALDSEIAKTLNHKE